MAIRAQFWHILFLAG